MNSFSCYWRNYLRRRRLSRRLQILAQSFHLMRDLLDSEAHKKIGDEIEGVDQRIRRVQTVEDVIQVHGSLSSIEQQIKFPLSRGSLSATIDLILVVLVLALGVRTFFFHPMQIPTGSMEPTFMGERSRFLSDSEVSEIQGVIPGLFSRCLFGKQSIHIDPEAAKGLPIQSRRPNHPSRAGPEHKKPEKKGNTGPQKNNKDVIFGKILPEDFNRPLQHRRPRYRELVNAPDNPGQVTQDQDQGIGKEELVELFVMVEPAKQESFDEPPKQGHGHRGNDYGPPEVARGVNKKRDTLVSRVCAQHIEGAMGKIQDSKDTKYDGKTGGNQKNKHGVCQPMEKLNGYKRKIKVHSVRPPVFQREGRKRLPVPFPENGQAPRFGWIIPSISLRRCIPQVSE